MSRRRPPKWRPGCSPAATNRARAAHRRAERHHQLVPRPPDATSRPAATRSNTARPSRAPARHALGRRQLPPDPDAPRARAPDAAGHHRLRLRRFRQPSTEPVTGIGMAARTTTLTGAHAASSRSQCTNPLDQTTTQGVEHGAGASVLGHRPNSLTTSWDYDAFGRRTLRDPTGPDLDGVDLLGMLERLRPAHPVPGAAGRAQHEQAPCSAPLHLRTAGTRSVGRSRSCSRRLTSIRRGARLRCPRTRDARVRAVPLPASPPGLRGGLATTCSIG